MAGWGVACGRLPVKSPMPAAPDPREMTFPDLVDTRTADTAEPLNRTPRGASSSHPGSHSRRRRRRRYNRPIWNIYGLFS